MCPCVQDDSGKTQAKAVIRIGRRVGRGASLSTVIIIFQQPLHDNINTLHVGSAHRPPLLEMCLSDRSKAQDRRGELGCWR